MPILKYDKIQPHDMLQNSSQQNSDGYSYWYEKGHWVEQFCYKKNNCAIVAINLLSYFKHQLEILFIITIFLIISASLTFAISCRMYKSYMVLGRQLKRGLNMRQVECVYQPIFSMKNNYLEGCEVLCRWRNEDGEQISPDLFIGEIEKNGQSRLLTKIVLKKAVAELTHAGIFGQIRTAINTFPDDIASNHINKLIDNEVPSDKHHTITIEVTEKEIDDLDSVVKNIDSLQRQHVKFAIDDFGTGYSNFQHLAELGVDYLKIDQSFVRRIEPDSLRGQLVNNMVKIAHTLQLKTVAEGVEKQEQFDLLKKMGVDFSQGYLHAKPMPIEEFSDYVKGHIKPF
ncbi:MAG: EAL domain-containing protein [Gammaproteobacteria bacterium]|nr:EAL domain-containing protein [Gammaproteobacteria bacterium]